MPCECCTLQALLEEDPTCEVNSPDDMGKTCLHHAARRGDSVAVDLLVARPNLNTGLTDHNGRIALQLAALAGSVECVSRLAIGDHLNNKGLKDHSTALMIAVKSTDWVIGAAMVSALCSADGIDLDAADTTGSAPLHVAAAAGRTDIMQMLMDGGCDRDVLDIAAEATPLMYVSSLSHTSRSSLCLVSAASVDSPHGTHPRHPLPYTHPQIRRQGRPPRGSGVARQVSRQCRLR